MKNYKNITKIEDLRKYLLQRGVTIGNNARKADLTEKVIFVQVQFAN